MSIVFRSRLFSGNTLKGCFHNMSLFFWEAYEGHGVEVDLLYVKIFKDDKDWKVLTIYKTKKSENKPAPEHVFRVFPLDDDLTERIMDCLNAHISENGKVVFLEVIMDNSKNYVALIAKTEAKQPSS